jgi:hypothetical protein
MTGISQFLSFARRAAYGRTQPEPDPVRVPVAPELLDYLTASLQEAARVTKLSFVRLVDHNGRNGGAYIDADALNLLLKIQALIENEEELRRLLADNETEYVEADLERVLDRHGELNQR